MFPFINKYPRKSYPKSFLYSIMVGICYARFDDSDQSALHTRWRAYLQDYFGIDDPEAELRDNGVEIKDDDDRENYLFGPGFAYAIIHPKNYKSFGADMLPMVIKLVQYGRDVLQTSSVDYIDVRKANLFIETPLDGQPLPTAAQMRAYYISADLLALGANAEPTEREAELGDIVKHVWEHDGVTVKANTIYRPTDDAKRATLLLDTQARKDYTEPVPLDSVCNECLSLNAVLYDLFHWSITDAVLQMML